MLMIYIKLVQVNWVQMKKHLMRYLLDVVIINFVLLLKNIKK